MIIAPHQTLVLLSGLLILSFFLDFLSRRIRISAVLFLLATGMLLRALADNLNVALPDLENLLPMLGMVGLVLIVFEAALDLEIRRDRLPLIGKSLLCSAAILAASVAVMAGLFQAWTGAPLQQCALNATPLAVISSAVAIPSVGGLEEKRREFIVYESTFSDILGIVLFNFLLADHHGSWASSVLSAASDIGFVILLSAGSIVLLGWMLAKTRTGHKLALVLAVLVLLFAGGKWAHLPTLLLVFGLGISLNNANAARNLLNRLGVRLRDLLWEVRFLKRVTAETTFMVRTYFFVVFGLSVTWSQFSGFSSLALGLLIYAAVLAIRYVLIRTVPGVSVFPETFIAPRGLITILLFYSIPPEELIPQVSRDALLVVVLLSIIGMAVALRLYRNPALLPGSVSVSTAAAPEVSPATPEG
jgi:NhaP-type Na+/H+ or K+/H+ antiporter